MRCQHDGCGWHAVAPSEAAARDQYVAHVVAEHATDVDVDVPDGMVQVRVDADDEWVTVTPERAVALHDELHENDE